MYLFLQWNTSKENIFKFITGCIFDDHFRTWKRQQYQSNDWPNLFFKWIFIPLKYMKKMVYFAFIKLDYVRKF